MCCGIEARHHPVYPPVDDPQTAGPESHIARPALFFVIAQAGRVDTLNFRQELHHGRVVTCHVDRPADIHAMFMDALRRAPGAVAAVDGDERWTYAALADRIDRCAWRLAERGLVAGDRLGILLDNRPDYLTLLLAAARSGIICVPMNMRQRPPETGYALTNSGAVAVIYEDALIDQLPPRGDTPAVRHWLPFTQEQSAWAQSTDDLPPAPDRSAVGEDDPFCILYTSGTTGRPKGAVLTHLGIVTGCIGTQRHMQLGDAEAMILAVPASHVTGILLVLMLSIRIAGKVVFQRGFKARAFLELAEREKMSFAILVPAMYKLCLMEPDFATFDLRHWRIGAYGGAPMAEATIAALAMQLRHLSLVNTYGSTETTSPAVMMPLGAGQTHSDKVGRALPYARILIMDDNGRQCRPGDQGEIWIAGPMTVPGYWDNPVATQAGFAGGYWKSGDIGSMDEHGYIRVLDRMKDMINRGGFKIYSAEVENVLMAHDAVTEAAVVGRPCPVLGERVEAFVVVYNAISEQDLRAFCAAQLSDYKVPDHITSVAGPLPRNANGKLMKATVRMWAMDGSHASVGEPGRR